MKVKTFSYYALKYDNFETAFNLTYPEHENKPAAWKAKAIKKILQNPEIKKYFQIYKEENKKEIYDLFDVEKAIVSICETSVMDFLTVAYDSLGQQKIIFKPKEDADLKNIKSFKRSPTGEITITMYDRLDALKSLAVLLNAKSGSAGTGGYGEIQESLSRLLNGIKDEESRIKQNDIIKIE